MKASGQVTMQEQTKQNEIRPWKRGCDSDISQSHDLNIQGPHNLVRNTQPRCLQEPARTYRYGTKRERGEEEKRKMEKFYQEVKVVQE